MKKSRTKPTSATKPSPGPAEVFERTVGGDDREFTIVCHPADAGTASGKDVEAKAGPDLVCRIIDVKDRPAN